MAKARERKPMTADAKARLKVAGEAKKGFDNLAGYNRAALMATLDELANGTLPAAYPPCEYDPQAVSVNAWPTGSTSGNSLRFWSFRWNFSRRDPDRLEPKTAGDWQEMRRIYRDPDRGHPSWVRLRHCPDDAVELIKGVLPSVELRDWVYGGPQNRNAEVSYTLFPLGPVLTLLKALFPNDWTNRIGKYLHGYTRAYVACRRKPDAVSGV